MFWAAVLQIIVLFVLLKVGQILYWNLRKSFYFHPWLLEIIVAIVWVVTFHLTSEIWWWVFVGGLGLGIIRGDQEGKERETNRQLS